MKEKEFPVFLIFFLLISGILILIYQPEEVGIRKKISANAPVARSVPVTVSGDSLYALYFNRNMDDQNVCEVLARCGKGDIACTKESFASVCENGYEIFFKDQFGHSCTMRIDMFGTVRELYDKTGNCIYTMTQW